jgi:hypothetical protein
VRAGRCWRLATVLAEHEVAIAAGSNSAPAASSACLLKRQFGSATRSAQSLTVAGSPVDVADFPAAGTGFGMDHAPTALATTQSVTIAGQGNAPETERTGRGNDTGDLVGEQAIDELDDGRGAVRPSTGEQVRLCTELLGQ